MKKMKLYILKHKNKIVSITESKSVMEIFILQMNFNIRNYELEKITNQKKIDKLINKYYDLYLFEYEGFILPNIDIKYIERIYDEYKRHVNQTIQSLKNINSNCIMTLSEHDIVNECISILKKHKKKDFNEFINLNEIIRDYYSLSMRSIYEDYENMFLYKILT